MAAAALKSGGRLRSAVAGVVMALVAGGVFGVAAPASAATDYTVNGVISLCGVHTFGTLTIPATATLRVAGTPSATDTTGTGPDSPSARSTS